MKIKFLLIMFFIQFVLFAETILINPNGFGGFATIQDGIDAAQDNDHILIYPGTYYENVNTNGKDLIISSLEMTTGNPAYIDSTIINGNASGSCINIENDENITIRGLSMTNGTGCGNFIEGGGIRINSDSIVNVVNCNIFENKALCGGGIMIAYNDFFSIEGCKICDNYANVGGGIYFKYSGQVSFSNENRCSIYNNYAGCGIDILTIGHGSNFHEFDVYLDKFTVSEYNNFYAAYDFGGTTLNPYRTFIVNEGILSEINQDFFVSPNGNNSNSGLSPDQPLQTITLAMHYIASDSINPKTVYLAPGNYNEIDNNQILPLPGKSYVTLKGENAENTIIENVIEDNETHLFINTTQNTFFNLSNLTFTGLNNEIAQLAYIGSSSNTTFTNLIIKDNIIQGLGMLFGEHVKNFALIKCQLKNNIANKYNAGLFLISVDGLLIEDCVFEDNWARGINSWPRMGGACISAFSQSKSIVRNSIFRNNRNDIQDTKSVITLGPHEFATLEEQSILENCLIHDNLSSGSYESSILGVIGKNNPAVIRNCTIINNGNTRHAFGSGGYSNLYNNIFNNFSTDEIWSFWIEAEINLSYNAIKNGENGCFQEVGIINYLEGNIEDEPLLETFGEWNYYPSEESPVINAGTPDTTGLNLPEFDLAGNPRIADGRIDMGCYEYQPTEYGDIDENGFVQGYDAALVLQYSIGIDPLPVLDPLPWEDSRVTSADVDGNEEIEAYDASLILQYAIGLINQFPVEMDDSKEGQRNDIPFATIDISIEKNELVFKADRNLYSLMIEDNSNLLKFGEFEAKMLSARNGNKFAFCSATSQRGEFLRIPFTLNDKIKESKIGEDLIFSLSINSIKEDYRISIDELIRNYHEVDKLPDYYISVAPNPISLSSNSRNKEIRIFYTIAETGKASLNIYNIKGQKIANLIDAFISPSTNESLWNLKNENGNTISSGQYFLRLEQNGNVKTKKFLVVK